MAGLILGLAGSLHCIGMCGPIAFALGARSSDSTFKMVLELLWYHLGKTLCYVAIGVAAGFAGKALFWAGMQQRISIVLGVSIVVFALYSLIGKRSTRLNALQRWYNAFWGSLFKRFGSRSFFIAGFLNGLLPCGLTWMAVAMAITAESVLASAITMALFGIGTAPALTAAFISKKALRLTSFGSFRFVLPLLTLCIGLLLVVRGMGLNIPYVSPPVAAEHSEQVPSCH